MKKHIINFDSLVSLIATFGVPGLVLVMAIGATGLYGAAALTTALAALGPGGMVGGICVLGIAGLVAQGISKFTFDRVFKGVIRELYKRGETKETILLKIENYKISHELKLKLKEELDKLTTDGIS